MTTETIPINAPRSLKLTKEQSDLLQRKYEQSDAVGQNLYVQKYLLTDLLEVLGDPHAEAKIAWSQGKEIEWFSDTREAWFPCDTDGPAWAEDGKYRPEPDAPWVPKVGEWVTLKKFPEYTLLVSEVGTARQLEIQHTRRDDAVCVKHTNGFDFVDLLTPATAEEIATAKAKIKADKLAELDRETAQKRKQIEEECK